MVKTLAPLLYAALPVFLFAMLLPLGVAGVRVKKTILLKTPPLVVSEFSYDPSSNQLPIPPNETFWLAIPRLAAISPVDQDVNLTNAQETQYLISKGRLLHSQVSSLPGQPGTTVIVSHYIYQTNWTWINNRYFFANLLVPGDELLIGFGNKVFSYQITEAKTIESLPDILTNYESSNLVLLTSSPFIAGPKTQIDATLKGEKPI